MLEVLKPEMRRIREVPDYDRRKSSKHPPAKPVALACEPLKAAGKAFSESASVSQSEVAIGF